MGAVVVGPPAMLEMLMAGLANKPSLLLELLLLVLELMAGLLGAEDIDQ